MRMHLARRAEFAGLEFDRLSGGVENARLENNRQTRKGGICRTGK